VAGLGVAGLGVGIEGRMTEARARTRRGGRTKKATESIGDSDPAKFNCIS
jgi:hypothetical protein